MSTTDQPAPDERTANEKATEVVAEFANIPSAYRDNPIAVATRQGLMVLNERLHALESAPVAEVEVVEFAGDFPCCARRLPDATEGAVDVSMSDGIAAATTPTGGFYIERPDAATPRRSTPEENARADARAEQLQARAAELTGIPVSTVAAVQVRALLAGVQLSRDDARAIHDAVNARTAGTAKQKLTERIEQLEREVANWKRREDAAVNAWGEMKRARDELIEALRLTVEYVGTSTLPPLTGWSWYDALAAHAPEIAARFAAEHDKLERLRETVEERLVKDEQQAAPVAQPAAREGSPKHLRTRPIPRTSMADLGRRLDEARQIPAALAEEIIASSPHPVDQELVAEQLDHDPQIPEAIAVPRDLPVRPLQAQIDNAIADTAGGVAALLRHFGIDPEQQAPPAQRTSTGGHCAAGC